MSMNFEEFVKEAQAIILDYLPDEYRDAKVEVMEVNKLNASYTGMMVKKEGDMVSPSLNLNAFFETYQNGLPMDKVLDEMADTIRDSEPVPSFDIQAIQDYSKVKEKLFIRVHGVEGNEETLNHLPHKAVEDMAVTYHILADNAGGTLASITVTENLMNLYGVSEEQLHSDALESASKLFPVKMESMEKLLRDSFTKQMLSEGMNMETIREMLEFMPSEHSFLTPMWVLTNEGQSNGAAALFYPDAMKQVGEQMEGDYFVLPSSVHECIILPDNGEMSAEELREMVINVNATEVAPQDRLTDQVYHYDCAEAIFEKAATYEERKACRAAQAEKPEKTSVLKKLDQKKQEAIGKAVHTAPAKASPEMAI